jgi:D-alanyl-D-alanine carboxypeptidase
VLKLAAFAALGIMAALAPSPRAALAKTAECAGALPAAQVAAIRRIAERERRKQHIAGLTVGVGRNGRVLFACGYGLRDRERELAADAATIYPIGSITKQFTATAVMLLAADGKVNIDDRLARYLPKAPHAAELTVRQLLNQTSGLPEYVAKLPLQNLRSPLFGLQPEQYVATIAHAPLAFKPGSKWQYSNTNYLLLGMLVTAVSGEPYERFVRERILAPQQLGSTQFLKTFVAPGSDSAHGYEFEKGSFVAVPDVPMAWGNAAGALGSTVADVIRWDGAFFGDRILDAAGVRAMTTPPKLAAPPAKLAMLRGYAFGWAIGVDHDRRVVWHNGGVMGARAMNATLPHNGLEVVVLTNAGTAQPEKIALAVAGVVGE